MTNIQFISKTVATAAINIQKTIQLLSEDCTIPFISRYRKDQTGNLDEVQIEQIAKLSKQYDEIVKRKESILKTIEEQGQLTLKRKQAISYSLWPLAHWIAKTNLHEAQKVYEWIVELNPQFDIPEKGLLRWLYRNAGFASTEKILFIRRVFKFGLWT